MNGDNKPTMNRFGKILFILVMGCLVAVFFDSTGIMRVEATRPGHQAIPAVIGLVVFALCLKW